MEEIDGALAARPLFVTADVATRRRLRELAAAAGTDAWEVADAVSAWRYWGAASSVTIGPDAAEGCAAEGLPRRRHVMLLAGDSLGYEHAWTLAQRIGAGQVATLPHAAGWLSERLSPGAGRPWGKLVIVTNARGGAGASTLACGLAVLAARRGRDSVLIDADPRGGGLDTLLGWEEREGLRWSDLAAAGPYDPRRLRARLPGDGRLRLLTFDRDHPAVPEPSAAQAVVAAARRGSELVIVDVPRYCEPWVLGAVTGGDLLTVVTPGQLRAVAALRQIIGGYAGVCDRAQLVLRHNSGELSAHEVSEAVGVPVAARWRPEHRRRARAERHGMLATRSRGGPLPRVCGGLLRQIDALRPASPGGRVQWEAAA